MMKRLLLFSLCAICTSAQTTNIPIQNPSFEQYGSTTQGPCGLQAARVPGWNTSFGTGILVPDLTLCHLSASPDGKAVLVVNPGYSISQDLPAPSTQPRGTYLLRFFVGNYDYQYAGEYTVSLYLSTWTRPDPLCSVSGWAIGEFVQILLTCSLRDWPPGSLKIVFAAEYEPLLFDKVSLTFTPSQ